MQSRVVRLNLALRESVLEITLSRPLFWGYHAIFILWVNFVPDNSVKLSKKSLLKDEDHVWGPSSFNTIYGGQGLSKKKVWTATHPIRKSLKFKTNGR